MYPSRISYSPATVLVVGIGDVIYLKYEAFAFFLPGTLKKSEPANFWFNKNFNILILKDKSASSLITIASR